MAEQGLADRLASEKHERTVDEWSTLLGKMLGGPERFDVAIVPWPGRDDLKVGLRLLSDFDMAEADTGARAWAKAREVEGGRGRLDDREYVARYMAEALSRALVHPETKQRLVGGPDELRKAATRDELDALALALTDHQETMAPQPYQLSDEEIARLAEAVRKPDPFRARALATCGPSTLRRCITLLANRLNELDGSRSSRLTQPTGSTSES